MVLANQALVGGHLSPWDIGVEQGLLISSVFVFKTSLHIAIQNAGPMIKQGSLCMTPFLVG